VTQKKVYKYPRWRAGFAVYGLLVRNYENLLQVFGGKRFSSAFSIGRLGYGRFYQAFSNKNVSERQKGKFSLDDSTEMDLGSV